MLPVQSGYRFVLTYNLIHAALERHPSAAGLDIEQSEIDRMLAEWHAMQGRPWSMCYVLQHKYTGANLQLRSLKGDDYYRCSQLDRACQSNGHFCLFLSWLELTVTRTNNWQYRGEKKEELCLNDIVTLQGIRLQGSLVTWEDCLAQRNLYEAREHDEQWGGEHLGNEYADIQQVYLDAVRVMLSLSRICAYNLCRSLSLFLGTI